MNKAVENVLKEAMKQDLLSVIIIGETAGQQTKVFKTSTPAQLCVGVQILQMMAQHEMGLHVDKPVPAKATKK